MRSKIGLRILSLLPSRVGDIARQFDPDHVSHGDISAWLVRLVKGGYATKTNKPQGRSVYEFGMTADGRELLQKHGLNRTIN